MKGYITVPHSVPHKVCRYCGSHPVIALSGKDAYVVKCPADDTHYQTSPGLIDIADWNLNNEVADLANTLTILQNNSAKHF
jgi:hypothetical protein